MALPARCNTSKTIPFLLRLVFYAPRFYPAIGGLERVTEGWAQWLHQQGHHITVLTATSYQGGTSFPFEVLRNASWRRQFNAVCKADVVVQFDISLKGLPLWWLSRKPLVISHHTGFYPLEGTKPMLQQLKQLCSNHFPILNTACSAYLAKDLKNAVVVHSPYDDAMFSPRKVQRAPCSFLFVGRLVSIKGLKVLLQSMVEVIRRLPAARLTIVGKGSEEPMLRQFVEQAGLLNAVEFCGPASPSEVVTAMATHEVLVVPSLQEPFGTVVLEALAMGCRVVTTTAGGLPEAGGSFTRKVPPNDALALAAAMVQAHYDLPPFENELRPFLQQLTVDASAALFLAYIQESLAKYD